MPKVQSAAEAVVLVNHVTINPEGKPRLSTLVQPLFSFDQDMRVDETLSNSRMSTLMQL